ncbi:MAG: SEC-C domain-containing protein, partial [Planctomycetes bacterium]|nr:SEC-C domain-containing protein [Planctomycetota bacterium]
MTTTRRRVSCRPECAAFTASSDGADPMSDVGRNEPCPCGSGRK